MPNSSRPFPRLAFASARRLARMPNGSLAAPTLPDEARLCDELANLPGRIGGRRLCDIAPLVPRDLRQQAARDRRARLRPGDGVRRDRRGAMVDPEPGRLAPPRGPPGADA